MFMAKSLDYFEFWNMANDPKGVECFFNKGLLLVEFGMISIKEYVKAFIVDIKVFITFARIN